MGGLVTFKDSLPLLIAIISVSLNAALLLIQRRQSHRLDAIAAAYKAEIDLYRGAREDALRSHRGFVERQLADVHVAIVSVQRIKNAVTNLIEASTLPNTYPRAATLLELSESADAAEDAHSNLTKWFNLSEMMPLHRCKSACATLAATASSGVHGNEQISHISEDLLAEVRRCRALTADAQEQLKSLATTGQHLLTDSSVAPRPLG